MEALKRANNIRSARAQLKRDLKAGKVKIQTLLLDPPEYVQTAITLALDYRPQLAEIRRTLQNRIASSPLCIGYARAVEAHYRDLWRSWCHRQAEA